MTFFVSHSRLFASVATGLAAAVLVPGLNSLVTRALIGWNVGTWTFLALISVFMVRADHGRLKRVAAAHAESAVVVLAVMVVATLSTLVAIVYELSAAKLPGSRHALPHVFLALSTVVCSWLLLPTLFTLTYASHYYARADSEGDTVESGDTLVVIESMKMEIPVITEDAGVVKEILVKEKDPVAEGQVVAILEG